ncbi:hypothetical protein H6P81_018309 [Aristolochia fimbriata]|uniref:Reverse transcriptase/retrotransposon-derived protein RNase H-like domain-containing protein n=1 Tax=Aristolochia fimbriata TaxID=158543 RepID=A0AAV7E0P9_ARIFI|nr:hypothetical protein H6P81_018309 [Aristolochia fimbriata]
MKQFPNLAQLPSTRSNEGFDPNAYRLMARARGNLTKDQIHEKPPVTLPVLTPEQEKLRNEGHRINQGRLGLSYQKEKPIKIYRVQAKPIKITRKTSADVHQVSVGQTPTKKNSASNSVIIYTLKAAIARARAYDSVMVNHISVADDSQEDDEFILDDAPATFEDGGQTIVDELKKVDLGTTEDPRLTFLSASLSTEEEVEYMSLLRESRDIFAWNYTKMLGLDPRVTVHKLVVHPSIRPVKQSRRRFRPELLPKIEKEVDKLIAANFIREVKYPSWITNIVPVKKKNGQIRVYVDFRDLNKACPKDDFPLPITELMVDATTGHEALSFLDGSSGYNKIRMDPKDEELTAFHAGAQKHLRTKKLPRPLSIYLAFHLKSSREMQLFSRLLKKDTPFEWDESCRNTFNNIKAYLTKPPVLVAPIVDRPLLLYIAAQEKLVGALLAQCDQDNKECSLYYLS